jgi:hypothetical protein
VEREEGDNSGKGETFSSNFISAGGIDIMREYLIKLDVSDSTIPAVSFTENEVYRVQQNAKKQQCTVIFIVCYCV